MPLDWIDAVLKFHFEREMSFQIIGELKIIKVIDNWNLLLKLQKSSHKMQVRMFVLFGTPQMWSVTYVLLNCRCMGKICMKALQK